MPPQGIDFGRTLSNFAANGNVIHDHIPGAWLGDSGSDFDYDYEDFSDPDMTRSKARAIADSALADLQRASAEAEDERLRRQTLRERRATEKMASAAAKDSKTLTWSSLASLQREISDEEKRVGLQGLQEHNAAEGRKLAPAVAKSNKTSTSSKNSITAVPLQSNMSNLAFSATRRSLIDPSLNSTGSPGSSRTATLTRNDVSGVASNKPRRSSHIDPSPNSSVKSAGETRAHDRGFLSLMDDFNARGGAHTAATRRLVDGGLFSENQLAAEAARAKLRADAQAPNGEVTPENRLAAARARLATEGRVVATVSQRPSKSGSGTENSVSSQGLVRPQPPSEVSFTLGNPRLPTRPKMPTCVSTVTAQPGSSTDDGAEQPVHNELTIRQLLANKPQPGVEAGRASTSNSGFRTLPMHDRGQAPESSSSKLATTATAPTTATTASQSASKMIVDYAAVGAFLEKHKADLDDLEDAELVTHKLNQEIDLVDFDAGNKQSAKLTAATKMTGTTSSQSVSEKVRAIVRCYGDALNAFDDATAAKFVAYKLKEDADFDAGGKHSTKLAAAAKTTATTSSKSVSEKAHAIAHRYASAVKASSEAAQKAASQKPDDHTSSTEINAGKEVSAHAQHKTPVASRAQGTNGLVISLDKAKTAEVDHDFDVLTSMGPSAANGSPLPDPDLSMYQLDLEFSPTTKGFQGWEDDYDSDDSEEWDLGGLAEWKWVGEKSAQQSSAAKRQA